MIATKSSTDPEIPSAMVVATSLAERTMMISSALSRRICVPGEKPIFEGGSPAARAETVNMSSMRTRPLRTSSMAT